MIENKAELPADTKKRQTKALARKTPKAPKKPRRARRRPSVKDHSKVIDVAGVPVVIHSEVRTAELVRLSVRKLRGWVADQALPSPTATDAAGDRWYSETWVSFVTSALARAESKARVGGAQVRVFVEAERRERRERKQNG